MAEQAKPGTGEISGNDPEQQKLRDDIGHIPGPQPGLPRTGASTTPQQSTGDMEGGAGIGQGSFSGPARDKGHHKHDPNAVETDENAA